MPVIIYWHSKWNKITRFISLFSIKNLTLFINRNEFANQSLNAFQCSTQFRFRLTIFQFQSNFSCRFFFSPLHSSLHWNLAACKQFQIKIKIEIECATVHVIGKMCCFFSQFSNFQWNRYGSYSIFSTRKFQCTILRIDHGKIRFITLINCVWNVFYCIELLKLRFKKSNGCSGRNKTNQFHSLVYPWARAIPVEIYHSTKNVDANRQCVCVQK